MKKIIEKYEKKSSSEELNLVGIEEIVVEKGKVLKKGYYVGIEISILDAITPDNMQLLGITSPSLFLEKCKKYKALGVVYFPNTATFGFLEENDTVLETIEDLIIKRDEISQSYVGSSISEIREDYNLDPENPLAELYDLPLTLQRTSTR